MPRIVLFTGGSASNLLARSLETAGVDATHVVSVFDNGGSTGKLRRTADLPGMGDIRNRLCALARSATPESARVRDLFELRFSTRKSEAQLRHELDVLTAGGHPATRDLDNGCQQEVQEALALGRAALPEDFELTAMSLGNLLLLGHYQRTRSFLTTIDWAADLLGVGPRVLPVTLRSVHLGAELDNGQWLVGQRALTSEGSHLHRKISRLTLLLDEDSHSRPAEGVEACSEVLEVIAAADAAVFGFGSFYSSILPHLLVSGVAEALARRPVPRILLANPTADRETDLMTLADLISAVSEQASMTGGTSKAFLTHVVHFSGDSELAIPAGDTSCFSEAGGQVFSERDSLGFEAVADRAVRRVCSVLQVDPLLASSPMQPGDAVALFDLDHTLFDYASLRRNASLAALSTFCQDPAGTRDLVLEHMVPPTTQVLRELGFPDLRREWNCAAFFAWARLLDTPGLQGRAIQALQDIRSMAQLVRQPSPFEARREFRSIARSLAGSEDVRAIMDEALLLAGDQAAHFDEQLAVFDEYVAENAELVRGCSDLFESLDKANATLVIVTEGSSDVQLRKIEHLGLGDVIASVVVTDRTLGVFSLVEEMFALSDADDAPVDLLRTGYDGLCRYLVKTPSFYTKLVHSLVAGGPHSLPATMEAPDFLTPQQWAARAKPRLAVVGDRYNKDIEPFLSICPRGVEALRVLQGRYASTYPLHEVMARGLPEPKGYFPSLAATTGALLGWAGAEGPSLARPRLSLDHAGLQELAGYEGFASTSASRTLAAVVQEFGRHDD
jgi:CofD-related protein of GAK system